MRIVFAVLLAANLALAGYAWFGSQSANPDADLLRQQLNADKIRIIQARPMIAPLAKVACLEWGPFSGTELKSAQSALDGLQVGNRLSTREVSVMAGYWVYIPPLNTKAEVERKIVELERLGVRDYYAVEGQSAVKNAISLGVFKTEEAANSYLDSLRQRGVRSARVGGREHRVIQTALVVREPDVALTAKLAELRLQFPGTELKAVVCGS